jgi:hypothetical protein
MPAKSEKQKKFMDAVAHNKEFAKQTGVPQSVGKDFSEASKGMKFGSGEKTRADSQSINQPKTNHGDMALFKKGGSMASKMNPGFMAMMAKKKPSKMAAFEKSGKDVEKKGVKEGSKADMAMDKTQMMGMKKGGMKKMAAGGLSSGHKSANGIAQQGKTKGKQIVMAGNKGMKSGGMAKKYC